MWGICLIFNKKGGSRIYFINCSCCCCFTAFLFWQSFGLTKVCFCVCTYTVFQWPDHFLQKGKQCWVGRRNGLGEMMMMMGCSNKGRKKKLHWKIKNLHYPTTEKLIWCQICFGNSTKIATLTYTETQKNWVVQEDTLERERERERGGGGE